MRILIVDDSDDLRSLLELVLTTERPDWDVVGSADDGCAAIERAGELDPDLVLLDVSMPVMDGLAALPHLRESAPRAQIVMLSAFPAGQVRRAALDAGAAGFVEKVRLAEELVPALERILAGGQQS